MYAGKLGKQEIKKLHSTKITSKNVKLTDRVTNKRTYCSAVHTNKYSSSRFSNSGEKHYIKSRLLNQERLKKTANKCHKNNRQRKAGGTTDLALPKCYHNFFKHNVSKNVWNCEVVAFRFHIEMEMCY